MTTRVVDGDRLRLRLDDIFAKRKSDGVERWGITAPYAGLWCTHTPRVAVFETVAGWIIEVGIELGLDIETVSMATLISLEFMGRRPDCRRGELQAMACGALLIASKYHEIAPPGVDEFITMTAYSVLPTKMLYFEREILATLSFTLPLISPISVVLDLLEHVPGLSIEQAEEVRTHPLASVFSVFILTSMRLLRTYSVIDLGVTLLCTLIHHVIPSLPITGVWAVIQGMFAPHIILREDAGERTMAELGHLVSSFWEAWSLDPDPKKIESHRSVHLSHSLIGTLLLRPPNLPTTTWRPGVAPYKRPFVSGSRSSHSLCKMFSLNPRSMQVSNALTMANTVLCCEEAL